MSHSKEVTPLEDDEVDRAGVEVRQRTELTATNRVRAGPTIARLKKESGQIPNKDVTCM